MDEVPAAVEGLRERTRSREVSDDRLALGDLDARVADKCADRVAGRAQLARDVASDEAGRAG